LALQDLVAQTVAGLGYELVELERSAGGTLRVTIDFPWSGAETEEKSVNVEDCERVTRQLQYTLEVEEVDYKRLEVSSPGIDRPLRGEPDFERFAGEVVDITLKAPMGAAAAGQVAPTRRKFRGTLQRGQAGWEITWTDEPPGRASFPHNVVITCCPLFITVAIDWDIQHHRLRLPIVENLLRTIGCA